MHAFGKIVLGATVFAAQSRAGNILAGDGANGAVVLPPHGNASSLTASALTKRDIPPC